jgi:hypothetical protein
VRFDLSQWADGQVDVQLGEDWPLFNEALADSVSSLPPRGEDVLGPSTYWVDAALDGLEGALAAGSDRPFTGGNFTRLRVRDAMVEARFDRDDDDAAGELMGIDEFRTVLREWRRRILLSASLATSPLPDTYRRNPMPDVRP